MFIQPTCLLTYLLIYLHMYHYLLNGFGAAILKGCHFDGLPKTCIRQWQNCTF